jgi:CheY-like chemotaxis protein
VEADALTAARTALAAAPVEMILLNMHLPDGHEITLTAGRADRPVIIAVTASVPPEPEALRAAGCNDFLGKPYQRQQLVDILTRHLAAPTFI